MTDKTTQAEDKAAQTETKAAENSKEVADFTPIATQDELNRIIESRLNRFWSSDILTGNQTATTHKRASREFWSSDILTGNQTKN